MIEKRFQEALKAQIKRGPVTKAELARRTGISPSLIWRYLEGKSAPGLDMAERIAGAFGLTLFQLIGDAEAQPDHPIEECVRRVSKAALEGSRTSEPGSIGSAEPPDREATDVDLIWALGWVMKQPEGADFLERFLAYARTKQPKQKKE